MKLQVLLTAPNPAWSLFLDQEKVPYTSMRPGAEYPGRENAPVLAATEASAGTARRVREHLRLGGAVLADPATRSVLPKAGFASQIFILENGIKSSAEKWSSQEKNFTFDGITVTETVAAQKKSVLRAELRSALKKAFWTQGLPYAHLWYYPAPYRSVFSFRFDLDEYDAADHDVFCRLLEKYRGAVSCFACLKTFEPREEALRKVSRTGVELGSHGYVHHVYRDYTQNRLNFDLAEKILGKYGQPLEGFTAPHGAWHPTLQKLLEEKNYLYSSEFSLDYDNFPFFPILEGRLSTVLQIPTHPICEGVFLERYPYDEAMLKNYFNAVIEEKIRKEEPVLFFGHPDRRIGRHPEILENIFETLHARPEIWKSEFRGFARWWKQRHNVAWAGEDAGGNLKFSLQNGSARSVEIEILFPDGRREFRSLETGNSVLEPVSAPEKILSPVAEGPAADKMYKKIKRQVKRWLDWETKTPPRILRVTGPRTLAKYLLRRLMDPTQSRKVIKQ